MFRTKKNKTKLEEAKPPKLLDQKVWRKFLKLNGVLRLSEFYKHAYFVLFASTLAVRFYLGWGSGPPTLIYNLSNMAVFVPAIGLLVIMMGVPKGRKSKKRSSTPKLIAYTMVAFIVMYVSIIFSGLFPESPIDISTFIVALISLFSTMYFTAILFIILNAKKINSLFFKKYEIFTVLVATLALLLTILSSHSDVSVYMKTVLAGSAAIFVVLAAPLQLAKVTYEVFQEIDERSNI